MSLRTFLKLAAPAALLVVAASACSPDSSPTVVAPAPSPAPNAGLITGLVKTVDKTLTQTTSGLLSCDQTKRYSARQTVGPLGGVIFVGPHSLVIPAGALDRNVTIEAVAPAGKRVAVEFQPHGLQFKLPASLTMSYRQCGVLKGLFMRVVYVDGDETILESPPSLTDIIRERVTGQIGHFSSYMVAFRSGEGASSPE